MTVGRSRVAGVVAVLSVVLGWAEWTTWKASRDALPTGATDPRRIASGESVLVLGCPLPILQRWRVRIAVRSTDPHRARFVFSGGAVRGPVPEAQLMANYAVHHLGVPVHNVVVEDQSRTTVENVVNSVPLMADSPAIKIASNTFHARRARQILRDESPALAARLVRARDYVLMEWGPLHAGLVAFERYRDRRARVAAAG
ncbi:YdcF family protein [Mycobacterium kubicae]|uniref:YdcF family protein n=1 Tax=Mycobacterium kubicae TaxID=120959 RepID=UPI0018627C8A|nr:YdcF family protein [Mycobacterium kubicae]QNI06981.1 YdcF family protein [Mycobacterium kubicae]